MDHDKQSAVENAIRQKNRSERQSRRIQREWLRQHGLKAVRAVTVYHVQTQAISIPDWALKHALPHFSRTPNVIWVKQRGTAKLIAQYDREAGGTPLLDEFEARRCPYCKRWMIGFEAAEQRKREIAVRLSRGRIQLGPCRLMCQRLQT